MKEEEAHNSDEEFNLFDKMAGNLSDKQVE
jgi:hypothetical protein